MTADAWVMVAVCGTVVVGLFVLGAIGLFAMLDAREDSVVPLEDWDGWIRVGRPRGLHLCWLLGHVFHPIGKPGSGPGGYDLRTCRGCGAIESRACGWSEHYGPSEPEQADTAS